MQLRLIGLPLIALAASVSVSTSAYAAPTEYEMDLAHTDIHFSVMRFGFNRVIGHFREASGSISYDPDDISKSTVSVKIDVDSIDSGHDERDEHLRGEYWFNAAEYPHIKFQSTEVEALEEGVIKVHGDLSIHGETHRVPLKVIINKTGTDPASKKEALGVTVKTHISRSKFGIKTAPPLIDDDISIHIEMLAHRK